MRGSYFRMVCLYDETCEGGEWELQFSFKATYFEEVEASGKLFGLALRIREHLAPRVTLVTSYVATYELYGISAKLTFERKEKSPLVFAKPSPQASWVLVDGERLISKLGNHSLNMLADEFKAKTNAKVTH